MQAKATTPRGKRIDPMDRHVGNQIKIARLAAGWSQEKLGAALGLTFQQVQKYEKGANRVSGGRLAQIADALKLPGVEALFKNGPGYAGADNGGGKAEPALYDMLTTRDGQKLAKVWQRLSSKQRLAMLKLAEAIF